MSALRHRFERLIGLGPSDNPRAVAVGGRARAVERPVVSTPGARVRIARDGWDGEIGRLVLFLHRRAIPMELVEGPNVVTLDGAAVQPERLRERLR